MYRLILYYRQPPEYYDEPHLCIATPGANLQAIDDLPAFECQPVQVIPLPIDRLHPSAPLDQRLDSTRLTRARLRAVFGPTDHNTPLPSPERGGPATYRLALYAHPGYSTLAALLAVLSPGVKAATLPGLEPGFELAQIVELPGGFSPHPALPLDDPFYSTLDDREAARVVFDDDNFLDFDDPAVLRYYELDAAEQRRLDPDERSHFERATDWLPDPPDDLDWPPPADEPG